MSQGNNENFGIMDQGYFVARSEIIRWINETLKLNITKIEQLGSGAVYCQIIDAIYPGKVTMSKVNWKAKSDYEFIINYKILQSSFDKLGIKRYIQVQKLMKAKYQDNLEFIQWLKRYYDVNINEKQAAYPAQERRGASKVDFGFAEKNIVPKNFNSGGLMVPQKTGSSKEKRGESANKEKGDSAAKRLVSPANNKTPRPRITSSQKTEKRGSIIEQKSSQRHLKAPPHPNKASSVLHPPIQTNSKQKIQPKTESPKEDAPEEVYRPSRVTAEELQRYKKVVRDLQAKIEIITEITQAGDDAQTKLKFIEEVLSIGGSSKPNKISAFTNNYISNNSSSELKNLNTLKSEQIKEQISNESKVDEQYLNVLVQEPIQSSVKSSSMQSRSMHQVGHEDEEVF